MGEGAQHPNVSGRAGWMLAMARMGSKETKEILRDPDAFVAQGERPDGRRKLYNPRSSLDCAVLTEDGKRVEYFTSSTSRAWREAVTLMVEDPKRDED